MRASVGGDRGALAGEVEARRRALAATMAEQGIEALVVATEANAFYLTGYETTFFGNKSKPFVVVFVPPDAIVVCHVGEEPSVRLDAVAVEGRPYIGPDVLSVTGGVQIDYQVPAARAVSELLRERELRTVGAELTWHFMPGFTPHAFDELRSRFAGAVVDGSPAIWRSRRVK